MSCVQFILQGHEPDALCQPTRHPAKPITTEKGPTQGWQPHHGRTPPAQPAHLDKLTKAKVSQLGVGGSRMETSQQQILQLQVAVHYHGAEAVQVCQGGSDLVEPAKGILPSVGGRYRAGVAGEHLVQHMHLDTPDQS